MTPSSPGSRIALMLAAGLMSTCGGRPRTFHEIDLGVDVRLNAVEEDPESPGFVVAGAEGTVVRHDQGFTQKWNLGNEELHDVEVNDSGLWFVVGDRGTIYIGHDTLDKLDIEWVAQDSGLDADLHGVTFIQDDHGVTAFVVGDEVVATGVPTGNLRMFDWTELPLPPGGWGRLREIVARTHIVWSDDDQKSFEHQIVAVGEQGRIWRTDLGPGGWVAVDLGLDADLVDVNVVNYERHAVFCGTDGTFGRCVDDGCWADRLGDFDIVACDDSWLLDSDRRLLELGWYTEFEEIERLGWQPRGAAFSSLIVVGDEGRVGTW